MKRETLKTTEREHEKRRDVTPNPAPVRVEHHDKGRGLPERRDLFTMMHDMERMMEEAFRRPFMGLDMPIFRHLLPEMGRVGEFAPIVDMYEEGNQLVVKAELPGITKDNIKVSMVENIMTITGEKTSEEKVERKDYLRLERSHGTFSRTLTLPDGLDAEGINATFADGVLEIRIPRRVEHRTVRNIAVK